MCLIHNQIACLTKIKSHLEAHNVSGFDTLEDLLNFQNSYSATRQNIILFHTRLIEQEKIELSKEIPQLNIAIIQKRGETSDQLPIRINQLEDELSQTLLQQQDIFNSLINYLTHLYT